MLERIRYRDWAFLHIRQVCLWGDSRNTFTEWIRQVLIGLITIHCIIMIFTTQNKVLITMCRPTLPFYSSHIIAWMTHSRPVKVNSRHKIQCPSTTTMRQRQCQNRLRPAHIFWNLQERQKWSKFTAKKLSKANQK